jgi:hypothetical protein
MSLHFTPVDPLEASGQMSEDEYAEQFCQCEKPKVMLEIDCGSIGLRCATCEKPMSDWHTKSASMEPIEVTVSIEPGYCTCNMMDQLSCDCDQQALLKPVIGGEG